MKIEHIAMFVNDLEEARDFLKSNNGYHNKKTGHISLFQLEVKKR